MYDNGVYTRCTVLVLAAHEEEEMVYMWMSWGGSVDTSGCYEEVVFLWELSEKFHRRV